ncbi:MAG: 4Fe-4S ferredoxin, partial [Cyclobacteriaceae bacterium]|nr:4Fe-4S ferredoxin [Cyclobacteriaceae bacterium]
MTEKHSSVFKFINALHHTFEAANQELYSLYGITQDELFDLVARSGSKFTLASVDSLYLGADNTSVFKKKAWHDYGNWLEGREFNTPEELQAQLLTVVENINRYEIVKQKGFDRYQVKELTFLFAKDASDSSVKNNPLLYLLLTIGLCVLGAMLYILPKLQLQPGIKNNGIFNNAMKSTGWLGIVTGGWLILFYVLLYFYPEYMTNWVTLVDPVSNLLNGHEAGRFFLYGFIYTLCILVMGVRMMI